MNQNIKVWQGLLILVLFGGLLFAKFWASSASKSVIVYSYMHQHPDGNSYIKLADQLFGFNAKGRYQRTIDLTKLGMQEHIASDFAFFSNGDLLIHLQSKEKNFIENLQRFYRFTNPSDIISKDNKDGLFRCNTHTSKCVAFTQQALNINEAFGVAIDWSTDRVFVADTSRHRVYSFSSKGVELGSAQGFQFPNQIEVKNNLLFVADTNHHRLIAFDISEGYLGERKEMISIYTEETRKSGDIWPSNFMLHTNERWIINKKNNMAYGGVYIFDTSGKFIKKLQLPSDADPVAILQMGEQVLISDFTLDRIYRYSLSGKLLSQFSPLVLQKKQSELTQRRAHYDLLNGMFSILFVMCLVCGFGLALYQQYQIKDTATPGLIDPGMSIQIEPDESVTHWIKPSTRYKVLTIVLCTTIIGVPVIFLIMGTRLDALFSFTWKNLVLLIVIIYSLLWQLMQLRYKIGITENTLIVHSPFRSKFICPKKSIMSSDELIIVGKSSFRINQLYILFAESDIENHLYPAIKQGQQVDRLQIQTELTKNIWVRIIQVLIISALILIFLYFGVIR